MLSPCHFINFAMRQKPLKDIPIAIKKFYLCCSTLHFCQHNCHQSYNLNIILKPSSEVSAIPSKYFAYICKFAFNLKHNNVYMGEINVSTICLISKVFQNLQFSKKWRILFSLFELFCLFISNKWSCFHFSNYFVILEEDW